MLSTLRTAIGRTLVWYVHIFYLHLCNVHFVLDFFGFQHFRFFKDFGDYNVVGVGNKFLGDVFGWSGGGQHLCLA